MRVSEVHNIRQNPVFRSIGTCRVINSAGKDIFVRESAGEFEAAKNHLYSKIISKLGVITEGDIEKTIRNIINKTNFSRESIYKILYRLTTFSSYASLNKIREKLSKNNIFSLSGLAAEYDTPSKDFPICLTSVMKYIFDRNSLLSPVRNSKTIGIMLDSKLLSYLENLSQKDRKDFYDEYMKGKKLFILEDLEYGSNFLKFSGDMEKAAIDIIEAMQTTDLDTALNGNIVERAKKLGLDFDLIKNSLPENIDNKTIKTNVMPIFPEREVFSKLIDSMLCSRAEDLPENRNYLMQFLDQTLLPVSPLKYTETLKNLKNKIDDFILQKGKNPNNLYYIIPSFRRSFAATNYQYNHANNIKHSNYILPKIDNWCSREYNLDNLPQNSTVVVMDDCIITGLTLSKEVFKYLDVIRKLRSNKKDVSIILASAMGTQRGIDNLREMQIHCGRKSIDGTLTGSIIPNWDSGIPRLDDKFLEMKIPTDHATAITFPYMGPDSNISMLHPLLEKFLFSPNAQKTSIPNLEFGSYY